MLKIVKGFTLIFLGILLIACEKGKITSSLSDFKDTTLEKVKANLSGLPFLGRFIKLHPAPKELYKKTEEKMALLNLSQAKDLYPQEYAELSKKWERAKAYYKKKYFLSAEKVLKEVLKSAEELLNKVEDYNRNLKEKALLKYKEREKALLEKSLKGEKEIVKVRLYLWRLKNLIELGKYDEFEKELEKTPF
ncbi:hypothetical protein [Caldimicrobium thiodismutans]|nr:hypothetical protein [Caldimicrobium thiodismutans]